MVSESLVRLQCRCEAYSNGSKPFGLIRCSPAVHRLVEGSRWCLCATRWREALEAGKAPPVVLEATDSKALQYVTLEQLREHEYRG